MKHHGLSASIYARMEAWPEMSPELRSRCEYCGSWGQLYRCENCGAPVAPPNQRIPQADGAFSGMFDDEDRR